MKHKKEPYLSPHEPGPLRLKPRATLAGGLPAVKSAIAHMQRALGVVSGLKTMARVNQFDGFDCPGCAWPDPDTHRSKLGEYCENGAKAVAEEATNRRVDAEFFGQHRIDELQAQSDYWLSQQGRITDPVILRPGKAHYEKISWDEAFSITGRHLNECDHPDEAVFYTSGRTSNEAAFLFQLFGRMFGTNNFPDCSNMCHESSGVGLSKVIGVGKGTVTLDDFDKAECILVIGQNPGTNHPRMLTALQSARHHGAKIIHINPLPEAGLERFKHPQKVSDLLGSGTFLADLFLQVRINGDVALLKGIMKALLEKEQSLDHTFIEQQTEGFSRFASDIKQEKWEVITRESGLSEADIREAASLLVPRKRIILCWAMGLTQHKNAVANIQSCVNLLLMKGAIGKPGAGACPVRGHSNVQGDRTVGITARPKKAFLDALEQHFDFSPPRHPGLDTVDAIHAMHQQKIRVFFAMGGNFLSATPDTRYTAEALQQCALTVHVSTKLNRSHLITGKTSLILPCLGRTEKDVQAGIEQFVTVENSMGVVQASRGNNKPASDTLLSEIQIIAGLAMATLPTNHRANWLAFSQDYGLIRDAIEHTIPGFEAYNQRAVQPGGFYLPNPAREGTFNTDSKKAHFTVHAIPESRLGEDEFLMMTIRSHDQFNTTIYGLDDRYRGIHGDRRVVFLNPEDMAQMGLDSKALVDLKSTYQGIERNVYNFYAVPYPIPRRCAATYFPETNPLIPIEETAFGSNTPASKSIRISIHPVEA